MALLWFSEMLLKLCAVTWNLPGPCSCAVTCGCTWLLQPWQVLSREGTVLSPEAIPCKASFGTKALRCPGRKRFPEHFWHASKSVFVSVFVGCAHTPSSPLCATSQGEGTAGAEHLCSARS